MAKRTDEHKSEVIERGNIYFFYRPKVQHETAEGLEDVQRFYMMLSPMGKKVYRLMDVGRKQLPDPEQHERNWGFVTKVGHKPEEVEDALDPEKYQTKTRGERILPAARPAGEGVYAIVLHDNHTHLAYALELPKHPSEAQHDLRIEEEGSYIMTIKNPEKPSPPGAGLRRNQKVDLPKRLQEKFEGRRFINVDPAELLDYEGTEFILVGASEKPSEELNIELNPENETEASAEIFKDLHLEKELHPTEPLFKGKWK